MKKIIFILTIAILAFSAKADDNEIQTKLQNLLGSDWSIHGQATEIIQGYPSFTSPYSGANSLASAEQAKNSTTSTLFLGRRLWEGGEFYFDPETDEGKGLSSSLGVAGFPNGEVNKAGSWEFEYQTARVFVRQVIGLGGATEKIEEGQNQLASTEDISRITITAGKFAASDIFDNNSYSHDPRTQFLNWSMMESGAWDYPADARGYTKGFAIELNQERLALRYGAFMEPTLNGSDLSFHGLNNIAQVAELEERYKINDNVGKLHLLIFLNRNSGANYSEALSLGGGINNAIDATRQYGNQKYGFAISAEQQLTESLGSFARVSWNNGLTEDYTFTQIDESATTGLSLTGKNWGRADDVVGVAGVINGISAEQRKAIENGYYGIIVGDGQLNYAPEMIFETYYAFKINSYATFTPDYQFVANPGYNSDRGPANIFAARLHLEF